MSNAQLTINITSRSTRFAVSIIKLANLLPRTPAGFAIASQIVRSGTSIGANIHEAQSASSKKDFIHCSTIALKEARETLYWLTVIFETKLVSNTNLDSLLKESDELVRILYSIIKKAKLNSSLIIDH
ncbi:MAG: hypothetical protein ACD_30C00041G0006 [uncultured bacterium]|uniref:Four helix bundle protein n=3 Tax=Candidatus Daviesiibacteriota TaxID=1752718 RepID=A0A0G0EQ61_9BACT|nr:MAG: hypothetical protein ACD_30C00041G0006 [uncultured bacterium]KKQ09078.1 MAG: hypothetical protein US19_C0017G0023 [Candidatus Daviesbacteria bacterium GW2011_GWB1_36_5]KKQ16113.1 MAG: hypothetical protein US28_C0005G0028 [Candidatus Daviesbacteria bacterium GW2011_GWA1_36_8]OGE32161.1 MAG: hypothetical protein A3C99_02725 [Candidatus Daviesbacteria bacterium RIFCSPHIGHO2_02_FULL_37_9]OGE34592.1 MAG: hypothetical protein A3E66_04860 [Candidatus Daviesbacteria bacterium RIFCSPHIGHO2_12_FU